MKGENYNSQLDFGGVCGPQLPSVLRLTTGNSHQPPALPLKVLAWAEESELHLGCWVGEGAWWESWLLLKGCWELEVALPLEGVVFHRPHPQAPPSTQGLQHQGPLAHCCLLGLVHSLPPSGPRAHGPGLGCPKHNCWPLRPQCPVIEQARGLQSRSALLPYLLSPSAAAGLPSAGSQMQGSRG